MNYQSFLIAPFGTGLTSDKEPWMQPKDAFQNILDGYIRHGYIQKREGIKLFGKLVHSQTSVTAITNADPGVVTVTSAVGLTEGQHIQISYANGMTQVNGVEYIITNLAGNSFELYDIEENQVNTSGFGVYAGGGILSIFPELPVMGIKTFIDATGEKIQIAMDTRRACIFNSSINSPNGAYDPLDKNGNPFADYFSGENTNFFATEGFGKTGAFGTSTFYMTNDVDNIFTYVAGATVVNAFVPDANPTGAAVDIEACQWIFTLRQRLILLDTVENGARFPQRLRWSRAQDPTEWDQLTPGNGGFVDAPTSEVIVSAKQLGDVIIVQFTNSNWRISPTADPALPFRWDKINNFRACDAPYGSLGFDRFIISYGIRGIIGTDYNESKRIDQKIEDFVEDEINLSALGQLYSERNYDKLRSWTLYPSTNNDVDPNANEPTTSNRALIRTDEEGAWSIYRVALTDVDESGTNFSCLGFGETSSDLAWEDFTVVNGWVQPDTDPPEDIAWNGFGDERWNSFFTQENDEVFLGGDQIGRVHFLEVGGDDLGQPLGFELTSAGWNPWREEGIQAQLGYVDFYVDADTDTVFTVEFFCDDINTPYASQTLNCLPNLGFIADIQNIQKTNPCTMTADSNGLYTGDIVYIYNLNGMDELTGGPYTVTVVDENTITLDGINATSFLDYISGGTLVQREFDNQKCWKRAYAGGKGYLHYLKITNQGTDDVLRSSAFRPWFRPVGGRVTG